MAQCGESLSRQVSVTGTSTGSGVNWRTSNDPGTGTNIGQLGSCGHLRLALSVPVPGPMLIIERVLIAVPVPALYNSETI